MKPGSGGLALDWLYIEEVVSDILNSRCWQRFRDRMLQVLENNPSRQVRIFFLELCTLMADTASDIHIECFFCGAVFGLM